MNTNIGMRTIQYMKDVEAQANTLGFSFSTESVNKYGYDYSSDLIALIPFQDKLAPFHREAIFFTGTLKQVSDFLVGIKWARDYDILIKLSDTDKRFKSEKKFVADIEKQRVMAEKKKVWKILKETEDVG